MVSDITTLDCHSREPLLRTGAMHELLGRALVATEFPGSPMLSGLTANTGQTWESVRPTLRPRYGIVWRDITVCYVLIGLGILQSARATTTDGVTCVAITGLASLWIGYWVSSLMSFMHEAAHFNLHWDKMVNDRLANWLICPLAAEHIKRYRALHWQHHLHLGSPEDTEVTYHHAPTVRFLLEAALGWHTLRVFRRKLAHDSGGAGDHPARVGVAIARGMAVHGAIVVLAVVNRCYATAIAWCMGAVLGYPFLTALRQILEHRAADALPDADFTQATHGPVNRLFGTDALSATFGSAGFNRHLLHHWCPAVSYTRFDDLEAFLMRTRLASALDASRASYWDTLRQLMRPVRERRFV